MQHFWLARENQSRKQGSLSGKKDQGNRGAVTGGAQLDGFIRLIKDLLIGSGLTDAHIFTKEKKTLPGFFRPTKEWDLVIVVDKQLLASIEFKSQVGPSFGNNFNNRIEEALGSATDLWTAYREGAFKPSQRPWLGYLMLLEETKGSVTPVSVKEPHFKVFEEFRNVSYARRYELFCERLVRERLYDAACFLLSSKESGLKGLFKEPSHELSFENFAISLTSKAAAYAKQR
ncbi:MAG: PaeR7I family type II restriction endonuclease [Deltaproteobacteria bacterium]|nr:PaeR7I family type II restriction endonuclease [Deltaproteobacteria bacterium]